MASEILRIVQPGVMLSPRTAYEADQTSLPVDPTANGAVVEGEWLMINSSSKLIRPLAASLTGGLVKLPYISAIDKGRTDHQSLQGRSLSVWIPTKGQIMETTLFGQQNLAGAITYAPLDPLVLVIMLGTDLKEHVGLSLAGAGIVAPLVAYDVKTATIGTEVFARVTRAPYEANGVGVGNRRKVLQFEIL